MARRKPSWTCNSCGHTWYSKDGKRPLRCAKCKTPYWNRPAKPREEAEATLAEVFRSGELHGYQSGPPPWLDNELKAIDEEVCAESECVKCGHEGMTYQPFNDREHRSYRAFAVCPQCSSAEEF